jgi:carbon storage regulator
MLVIRRRVGESILIGDGIELSVIEIGNTKVKLGITAAANISVVRKEALLTREENRRAAERLVGEQLTNLLKALRGLPKVSDSE